jgi:hypothetical protein
LPPFTQMGILNLMFLWQQDMPCDNKTCPFALPPSLAGSSASTSTWIFQAAPNCCSSCPSNVLAKEVMRNNIINESS